MTSSTLVANPPEWISVYLAYVDDSGVSNEKSHFAIFSAVIIPDRNFFGIEIQAAIAGVSIGIATAEEFHAHDLYNGKCWFEGISETIRYQAIEDVLRWAFSLNLGQIGVVYGAFDRQSQKEPIIDPADAAFRKCLIGIESWVADRQNRIEPVVRKLQQEGFDQLNALNSLCILVMDDSMNPRLKERLRDSYRSLRPILRMGPGILNEPARGHLTHLHDGIYFGDSRDSIGIQIADLCAYFINKNLRDDRDSTRFFDLFKDQIKFSGVSKA